MEDNKLFLTEVTQIMNNVTKEDQHLSLKAEKSPPMALIHKACCKSLTQSKQ